MVVYTTTGPPTTETLAHAPTKGGHDRVEHPLAPTNPTQHASDLLSLLPELAESV
jgi:hypothetical protein